MRSLPQGATQAVLAYYGPIADARRHTAANCTVTAPNTQVTCTAVPGVGTGHVWTVCVAGACSTPTAAAAATSYRPPTVLGVATGAPADAALGWGRTAGGDSVTLTVVDVPDTPLAASTLVVTYSTGAVGAAVFTAAGCTIGAPAAGSAPGTGTVVCRTAPGAGTGLQWRVAVGGQTSPWSGPTLTTSYAPPAVTNVTAPLLPTVGGQVFFVNGTNLGAGGPEDVYRLTVRYGFFRADGDFSDWDAVGCTVVVPHVYAQCVSAPGSGAGLNLQVALGGGAWRDAPPLAVLSYLPPTVTALSSESARRCVWGVRGVGVGVGVGGGVGSEGWGGGCVCVRGVCEVCVGVCGVCR
jgi:hypothetical protein